LSAVETTTKKEKTPVSEKGLAFFVGKADFEKAQK